YWWMTCGLIGLAAYLLLMGSTIFVGLRLWWRAREPIERLTALSLGLGTAGLVIVELTTTVVPADVRGTALFASAIGILGAIHQLSIAPRAESFPTDQFHGIRGVRG